MKTSISLREYARRRGCSHEAVRRAIRDGRLRASVVATPHGPKIADVALADREWAANTLADRVPFTLRVRKGELEPLSPEYEALLERALHNRAYWSGRLAALRAKHRRP